MSWRRRAVSAGVGYAVAGPGGALVGGLVGGGGGGEAWHDLSDVPFGVNVEVEAEDDAVGRRWTLTFLSQVPSPAVAQVQLRDDAGRLVPGQAPFADAGGYFAASGPIEKGRALIYAPFGAAVPEADARVSLEVAVFRVADGVTPVGRATLDGALDEGEFDADAVLAPVAALVDAAGGGEEALGRLTEALGWPEAPTLRAWSADDGEALRFRFPSMTVGMWRELLGEVLGEDADARIDSALAPLR